MSRNFKIIVIFFLAFFPLQQSLAQVYSIEGFVKGSNNTTLPNITIVLKGLQNSVSPQRIFTDSLGYYRFDNIKQGRYIVAAESQEYGRSVSDTIELGAVSPKAVHHFVMEISAKALDEVVITNKKALIEAEKGKMIFNVAGNTANSGTSVLEVLKKIPGITIGQNDDILLKGTSGANVMIDGKMSYITGNQLAIYLKGLSADDVSKIEVITNPSAAFDASGNSGLINIVTKANKKKGYALNLRSGISKGAFWMNNQNISGSVSQDKWNAYASFDYNTPHRKRTGESGNSIIENDQKITLNRENTIPFKIYYYTWKIGVSWKLAPSHKIGAHYHGYLDDFSGTKTSVVAKATESGNLLSNVYSTYQLTEPYHYDAYNFDYLFEIDSTGKKITADARYISYRNYSDALLTADHYGSAGEPLLTNVRRTHQPGFIKIKSVQADAELPYDEINLKTGFKFAEVYNDNNFHSEKLDQDQFVEIEDMTDHFQYSEKIIAGYISASKSIAKISFDLGFRIEHTISEIDLANAMVNRSNNYTSFFPNFSASHQFQDDSRINIAVSKRINRPAYSGLNPVRWYNDEYFYFYGNPDLVPETAWLFSSSYVLSNKYIFNMEYSKRSNYISHRLSYDPNGVTIRSQSANFRNFDRFDFNTVTPLKISDSWDLQVLAGVNYTVYPISEADYQSNLERWACSFSLQQQLKFLKHYSADISMKYTSSELYGVYVTGDIFFMDFGVKRTLVKGLDAVVTISDVFNTYREIGYSKSRLTNYYYNEKPDLRRVSLTLRYNFGGELVNSGKKKTEEQQRL